MESPVLAEHQATVATEATVGLLGGVWDQIALFLVGQIAAILAFAYRWHRKTDTRLTQAIARLDGHDRELQDLKEAQMKTLDKIETILEVASRTDGKLCVLLGMMGKDLK